MKVIENIRRITEDLKAIEAEMSRISLLGVSSPECAAMIDELLTEDLIHDFKSSVDNMRHFLWSYIEEASHPGGDDLNSTLQAYRMRRVTEMLQVLETPLFFSDPTKPRPPEAKTFLEEIMRIASVAAARGSLGNSKLD